MHKVRLSLKARNFKYNIIQCLFLDSTSAANFYEILIYVASKRGIFRTKCYGQCGEGEGDCDRDEDCLPGFTCKSGGAFRFGKDYCTAGV